MYTKIVALSVIGQQLGSLRGLQHNALLAKSVWHPVVHLVGTGDVVLVVFALDGQINSAMTLDLFLPTSGDRPFYGAMVERRDGPSWLRDDDDDECYLPPDTSEHTPP